MTEIASASVRLTPDATGFATAAQRQIRTGLSGANRAAQQTERNLSRISTGFAQLGIVSTAAITAPVIAAGKASADLTANFETSFSRIEGLVGIAREEVQGFEEDVLSLAEETARAPQELADALFFITSAGLEGQVAIDTLTASAKAAAAGLGDTATVADAATSALNAYGTEALSAEQATAILVASVREGKVEADALAGSLGRVIPFAAELGVSFDQVGASIAAMTRLGLGAEEATTALRGIFASLLKPTQQASDALADVGLSFGDMRETLRDEGLLPLLFDLRDAFGDNEEAMARVFPNIRALSGVLNLVGENADEAEAIFASLAQTTEDDLSKAFQAYADTDAFRMEQANVRLQASMIRLGAVTLPIVASISEALSSVAGIIENLPNPIKQTGGLLIGLAAAGGPILLITAAIARTRLSMLQLAAAQTTVAASAKAMATAEGAAAAATSAAGAAAAGTARVVASSNPALVAGAGAAAGRGALLAGGAATASRVALRGLGGLLAGDLVGSFIQQIGTEEGTAGDAVKDSLGNAVRFGVAGAVIGSSVPVIGTAAGAIGGAIVGGIVGFIGSDRSTEEVADAEEQLIVDATTAAVENARTAAVGQLIAGVIDDAIADIGVDQAAALGVAIQELFVAGFATGFDFETIANGLTDGLIDALAADQVTSTQILDEIFRTNEYRSRAEAYGDEVGEIVLTAVQSGILNDFQEIGGSVSEAFEQEILSGLTRVPDLSELTGSIADQLDTLPSIFSDAFGEIEATSADAILELVQDQQEKFGAFEDNIREIAEAGLLTLAATLREKGPAAAAEAAALAEDIPTAFVIEGALQGVAETEIDAFLGVFADASPDERAAEFIAQFLSPFATEMAGEDGVYIGSVFFDGIGLGISNSAVNVAVDAARAAQDVVNATMLQFGIQSPSTEGIYIGQQYIAGINKGIADTPLAGVTIPAVNTPDFSPQITQDQITIEVNNPREKSIAAGTRKGLAEAQLHQALRGLGSS